MIRRAVDPDFACRTIFAILEKTARDAARCPTQRDLGEPLGIAATAPYTRLLADRGAIRVEVYGKNWRTIWICTGPFRGLHTQLPPFANTGPYKVLGPDRPSVERGAA
jgi:hypothetical protein